jgi:hypothetical protein
MIAIARIAACLAFLVCTLVAEDKPAADKNAYPLDYCATCGPEEKEELVTKKHKGREIKMCKGCIGIFNADPDGYVKKVDKVIKEAQKAKDDK